MSNCPNCGAPVQAVECAYCRTPVIGATDYSRAPTGLINSADFNAALKKAYADVHREMFAGLTPLRLGKLR